MSYKEEIESLEERLSFYRRNIGRNNARDTYLTQKIKRMEEQLELFKKAKAFDEIKECLHSAQSSIDRSENRKEERDHAVAFFNELVEMDILEVYERTERND